ncbi:MAG: maleylacetoacetate isomerase [Bdellovibrionales bacterium]|nr:maleylacetoacetate isomerase [Bdellovibrionales bacterium]
MELYNYFRSSASYRVRIALSLKKLPYDYKVVHLVNNGGEQNSTSYSSLNPMKQVPTLVDNNFSITQSLVILEYLDEAYPEIKLFPYNLQDRIRVKEFCEIINSGIQPLQNLKTTQMLDSIFNASSSQKNQWMQEWLSHGFRALESFMSKHSKTYTFGNSISAADCFLLPQIFAAKRFNFNTDNYPNVTRVYNSLSAVKEVQLAHPEKQPDFK